MKRFVGFPIPAPGTVITNPGFTTGTDRITSVFEAHDTLKNYTEPVNNLIGQGGYGSVMQNNINLQAMTRPPVAPGWFNAIISQLQQQQQKSTEPLKYVIKHCNTDAGTITTSILSEFALRNLDHPNIIAIHAVHFGTNNSNVYVDTQISMECMPMDMWSLCRMACRNDHIFENGVETCFADNELRLLAYQMLAAVAYLHSKLIIHGDIKMENFLVTAIELPEATHKDILDFAHVNRPTADQACRTFKVVKLADFGCCSTNHHERRQLDSARIGTDTYRAPELSDLVPGAHQKASFASDVWSCAAVLYGLSQFESMFPENIPLRTATLSTIIQQGGTYHPPVFPAHPQYSEAVIGPLVQCNPGSERQRPRCCKVRISHPRRKTSPSMSNAR
jgi:serine/threonine protein kinase